MPSCKNANLPGKENKSSAEFARQGELVAPALKSHLTKLPDQSPGSGEVDMLRPERKARDRYYRNKGGEHPRLVSPVGTFVPLCRELLLQFAAHNY